MSDEQSAAAPIATGTANDPTGTTTRAEAAGLSLVAHGEGQMKGSKSKSVNDSFGSVEEIPGLIRDLLYGDSIRQEQAYWALENRTAPGGFLLVAAYYVSLQILGDIKGSNDIPGRHEAYALLCWFLQSNGDDEEIRLNDGRSVNLTDACRSLIWNESELYLRDCIESPDSKVRLAAACILAEYPEFKFIILPRFYKALKSEADTKVRETIEDFVSEFG